MNELIQMYCYYEDMMMQNVGDEKYIMFMGYLKEELNGLYKDI